MLSVYPELAFHDNGADAIWLVQNKKQIAEALCKSVCDWFNMPYVEDAPESDYDRLVKELADLKEKYQAEHTSAQRLYDEILSAVERFESTEK